VADTKPSAFTVIEQASFGPYGDGQFGVVTHPVSVSSRQGPLVMLKAPLAAGVGEGVSAGVGENVVGAGVGAGVGEQMVSSQLLWHDDVRHSYAPSEDRVQYAVVQA